MPVNPATAIAKWKANMASAGPAMTQGVQSVTVSPNSKAAAASGKYLAGVQAAVSSGRYQNGNNAVTLADWQNATIKKGVPNMQTGVNNLSAKANRNMTDFLNYAGQVSATIQNMPKNTEQDSINRMLANFQAMKSYKTGGA